MILSKEQIKEFEEAAKPLMEWLNRNCHPHVTVLLDGGQAEIVEGLAIVKPNNEKITQPRDQLKKEIQDYVKAVERAGRRASFEEICGIFSISSEELWGFQGDVIILPVVGSGKHIVVSNIGLSKNEN